MQEKKFWTLVALAGLTAVTLVRSERDLDGRPASRPFRTPLTKDGIASGSWTCPQLWRAFSSLRGPPLELGGLMKSSAEWRWLTCRSRRYWRPITAVASVRLRKPVRQTVRPSVS